MFTQAVHGQVSGAGDVPTVKLMLGSNIEQKEWAYLGWSLEPIVKRAYVNNARFIAWV